MADDITISSTTDSQEQVEAALAEPSSPPEPEQQATEEAPPESPHEDSAIETKTSEASPEPEAGTKAAETTGEPAQEPKQEVTEKQQKPRSQQRIENLSRQLRAAEDRIAELQRAVTPPTPSEPPGPRDRPNIDEFDDLGEYRKAEELWLKEQTQATVIDTLRQANESQRAGRAREAREKLEADWQGKLAAASEKITDFDEVAQNPNLPVSDVMAETLFRHPNGTDILYYLGKHPEESLEIARMDPFSSVAAIGLLGHQFSDNGSNDATPVTPPKPISRAPDPITPIRSTSPPTNTSVDAMTNMSYDDYRRVRDAQEG
jgi:hypothetical protein